MSPAGTVLPAVALTLAVATHVSFVWAIRRFFVAPGEPQAGMRAIAGLGAASALLQLAALSWRVATPLPFGPFQAVGLALFVVALSLFWAAVWANRPKPLTLAFSADTPQHLVAWGPYRRIRHPFYTAYLAAWIAGAFSAGAPELLLTAVAMGMLYVRAARSEEAKFARSPLANEYAAYRRRTGMFWPAL